MTEARFNSLPIYDERWLKKALETGTLDLDSNAAVIRDVFRMFVQNDSSVYWHEPTSGDSGESSEVLFAQMRESLKNSPCEEVLAAFKTRKGLQASEALNMLLLEDVILYVADEEIDSLVEEFCCLTGATKVDTVTPCLTTHIVCMRETPMLRGTISSIHAKVTSGATSAKAALTTERSHLDLVTPNWLKECLMQ